MAASARLAASQPCAMHVAWRDAGVLEKAGTMEFNFPVAVSAIDTVPEAYRPLYSEQKADDGSTAYKLDQGLAAIVDTSKLESALKAARKERDDAMSALKSFKSISDDPSALIEKMKTLEAAANKGREGDEAWAKMKTELETSYKKEVAGKDERIGALQSSIDKYVRQAAIAQAISEVNRSDTSLTCGLADGRTIDERAIGIDKRPIGTCHKAKAQISRPLRW